MNFRFTIGRKLGLGFGVLVLAIFINGLLTYSTLKGGKELNEKVSNTYRPSIEILKDLNLLVLQSKNLIVDWLENEEQDTPEKIRLEKIHDYEYPEMRKELRVLMERWDVKDQLEMDSVFNSIDSLMEIQHDIMVSFSTKDSYRDLGVVFKHVASLEYGELEEYVSGIVDNLNELIAVQSLYSEQYGNEMIDEFDKLQTYVTLLGTILVIGGLFIGYFTIKSIVKPLSDLKEILSTMGKGVLPKTSSKIRRDEIGEMSKALNNLVVGLQRTSEFAKEIGEGNFNSTYVPLSKEDKLGNSLLVMRDNLALVADDDRKRNWTTGGLAKFGEILRSNNDKVELLTQSLISELVKYMDANQGGVFLINQEDPEDISLEMKGCYAWDRTKYLEQKVYLGEGLIGQSWQERSTLYVTDLPEDYIKITSGLGDASPTCLLVVPMIVNDEFFGVIEMASFNEYEEYQIKFVEKVAETTAATISSVRVNQKTKELLEQTQHATEQMRLKEEETREEQSGKVQETEKLSAELKASQEENQIVKSKNAQLEEENTVLQNLLLKASKELDEVKNA